jgi:hypothetical protein
MADGAQRRTCCPHCGLLLLAGPGQQVGYALVTDFLCGRMVNARLASYVIGPQISLCCAPVVLAFEHSEEAQRFQQGFGGQVLDLEGAVDLLESEMSLSERL